MVNVSPKGLKVSSDRGETLQEIIVESSDVPIRITGVTNPLSTNASMLRYSKTSGTLHSIQLPIDPKLAGNQSVMTVRVSTDHPVQPEVFVSVLILQSERKATP